MVSFDAMRVCLMGGALRGKVNADQRLWWVAS